MPLDRLVLILVLVIAAAGLTVWLAAFVAASAGAPWLWGLMLPAGLVAYVLVRVIADRLRSREDDRYDRMR